MGARLRLDRAIPGLDVISVRAQPVPEGRRRKTNSRPVPVTTSRINERLLLEVGLSNGTSTMGRHQQFGFRWNQGRSCRGGFGIMPGNRERRFLGGKRPVRNWSVTSPMSKTNCGNNASDQN
jgi:hypothetical protein